MIKKVINIAFALSFILLVGSCNKEEALQTEQQVIDNPVKGVNVDKSVVRNKVEALDSERKITVLASTEDDSQGSLKATTAYIHDLYLINGSSSSIAAPSMYTKINVDLNKGAGGQFIYLCYTRNSTQGTAIRDLTVYNGGSYWPSPKVGYPWSVVNSLYKGTTYPGYDLNHGSGGNYIYLYETRGTNKGNIKHLKIIATNHGISDHNYLGNGWYVVTEDLNKGAGGAFIYVCYKR